MAKHKKRGKRKSFRRDITFSQETAITFVVLLLLIGTSFLWDGTLTGFVIGSGLSPYNQSGFWLVEDGPMYNGEAYVSNVAGSELRYHVSGKVIKLLTQRRDDYGLLHVFVDGNGQLIDLYSPEPQYNVTVVLAENLSDTEHDVIISVSGGRNPNSRASFVVVDDVYSDAMPLRDMETNQTLPVIMAPVLPPEQVSPVNQSGIWVTINDTAFLNNTALLSNTLGSSLSYAFYGQSVTLVSKQRDDFGIMQIELDGINYQLDLWNETEQLYNATFMATGNGLHTFVINVTGSRNKESFGTYVLIDEVLVSYTSIQMPTNITIQFPAEINKPVVWKKKITVAGAVEIPSLQNLTVKKNVNGALQDIPEQSILVKEGTSTTLLSIYKGALPIQASLATGAAIVSQPKKIFVSVDEEAGEYEITYETPPPLAAERNNSSQEKEITVYSDYHYENITAYTTLPKESPETSIKLYHLVNGSKELFTGDISYFDENNNSLIDKIQWIVPHLSNQTYLVVTAAITDETTQYSAFINKPVIWKKTIYSPTLNVEIPSTVNVTIKKLVGGTFREVPPSRVTVTDDGINTTLNKYSKKEKNVTVIADESTTTYEVTYETAAPKLEETQINSIRKTMNVFSDYHYSNVTANVTLPQEAPQKAITLYHTANGAQEIVSSGITYSDWDNDSLIDEISWVVPHLSNESYEVQITILNVYSYPHAGENWSVFFNTTGIANLTVTPVNNTQWDREISFVELKCGNKFSPAYNNITVFQQDYSCNTTGEFISFVHIAGTAVLEFRFGDAVAYAYDPNAAGINASLVNITPYLLNESIDAAGMWNYSHINRSLENGSVWTWFVNGTEAFRDSALVGYWRLDGNASSSVGTMHGIFNASSQVPANGSGIIKNAMVFQRDDFVNISAQSKQPFDITDNLTITAWIQPEQMLLNPGDIPIIVSKFRAGINTGPQDGFSYSLSVNTTSSSQQVLRADVWTTVAQRIVTGTTNLLNTSWYHVALTYNLTNVVLYVNGRIENQLVLSSGEAIAVSNAPVLIGNSLRSGGNIFGFNGSIDEVRIYNRTLSPAEIANQYNMMDYGQLDKAAGLSKYGLGTPAPNKPVSLWHFNEDTGNTIKDAMGLNYLTTVSGAAATFYSPGVYGTPAIRLDASDPRLSNAGAKNISIANNLTVEVWFYPGTQGISFGANGRIFSVGTTTLQDYELYHASNGSVAFAVTTDFPPTTTTVYSAVIPNKTFSHIVGVYNGSDILIYLNGTLSGRAAGNGRDIRTPSGATELRIGEDTSGNNDLNGTVDSLAIYS